MDRAAIADAPAAGEVRPGGAARLGRRAFGQALLAVGIGALLTADRPAWWSDRALPIAVDGDTARYLHAVADLPLPDWSLLAVTAALGAPGGNTARGLLGHLPPSGMRGAALGWTYRAEATGMGDRLAQAERVYARFLPPDRARHWQGQLAAEWARLAQGGQVDYSALAHLATLVNRERGLIARAELDDLPLIRQHQVDPVNQPKDVPTLLRERRERRALATTFRHEAARLLGTAAQRTIAAPTGTVTLLGDLGGGSAGQAQNFQLIRAALPDLDDATIANEAVYFTAGEFLAHEPATPPGRWADRLPADQRAYAASNTLSPRLGRAALLDPAHASRILWLPLAECRALAAELQALM